LDSFRDLEKHIEEKPVILDLSVINQSFSKEVVVVQPNDDVANINMSDMGRMFKKGDFEKLKVIG